jgi:hypothetical protein
MQKVDEREARIRNAFKKIETRDGRLRKDDIFRLLTVSLLHEKFILHISYNFFLPFSLQKVSRTERCFSFLN